MVQMEVEMRPDATKVKFDGEREIRGHAKIGVKTYIAVGATDLQSAAGT